LSGYAAASGSKYILNAFGISMDDFKIVGGIILSFIGFQMLKGLKSKNNGDQDSGLSCLIIVALGLQFLLDGIKHFSVFDIFKLISVIHIKMHYDII